ncbi:MAG: hypothetical protein WBE40_04875 [Thermoplasmata archaeon]
MDGPNGQHDVRRHPEWRQRIALARPSILSFRHVRGSRLRGPEGLAIGIALLMVVSALAGLGAANHTASSFTARSASAPSIASPPTSAGTVTASTPEGTAGACAEGSGAAPALAASASLSRSSVSAAPLYNSQVEPYAVLTGAYGYVAAGAALRDQGYGLINLTWPGAPSTSNLVAAYLIWAVMDDNVPPDYGTLNGVNVTGTWVAYATPSPCWAPTYIYTFVAEVTSLVTNGVNNLTAFPSGVTNGLDPWSQSQTDPMDEGASLVAIYSTGGTTLQQVTVYSGAFTTSGSAITAQLNYSTTNRSTAETTYLVTDGQLPGNVATWNGTVIDSDAFPGSDPKESKAAWSYGNLSDTKTFEVNVTAGSNSTDAQIYSTSTDCLTWIGQVLSVGVAPTPGPYSVVFQEQGLSNGAGWNVTTHGTTHTGSVVNFASSIQFTLANGSYHYTVGALPGYSAQYSGNYQVAGGPVYIRVLFHQILYPVQFNETGLPSYVEWWVDLTNSSQSISQNLSMDTPGAIAFAVGNGTFNFTAGELGLYRAVPAEGSIVVAGSDVNVTIAFVPPPLYNVTFVERNLPHGTEWGGTVETNWGVFDLGTTNGSPSLLLPNTTSATDYIYPVSVPGYSAPYTVLFGVYGAAEMVDVNYTELFTVVLKETGLPLGTFWSGSLTGSSGTVGSSSETANLTFSVGNGTYTFAVTPVWAYTATPANGTLTVAGGNATRHIVFTRSPTYSVSFTETGLAVGTLWAVELELPNGTDLTHHASVTSVAFSEPNGSYTFVLQPVSGYAGSPVYGYVTVSGSAVSEPIVFTRTYSVTFTESGLPSGSDWSVYFASEYTYSISTSIVVDVPDGSYTYDVYDVSTFVPTPASGSITVSDHNVTQPIEYASTTVSTYSVTFTETGLATGTNWSVELYGYSEWSTGASIVFTEYNGSFDFTVGGATGYDANPASGTVMVSGAPASQPIGFSYTGSNTFAVTFTESGLPQGATWYINITGQSPLSATISGSSGTSVVIRLANDSYTFAAAANRTNWTTSAGGSFTVAGAPLAESVPFTFAGTPPPPEFSVVFTESGLPNGATWYLNLTGGSGQSATVSGSTGTQLTFTLSNGSYTYSAATSWRNWTAHGGTFAITGSGTSLTVPFTSSGAPTGTAGSSSSSLWTWVVVGIVVAALLLLFLFVLYRRRKKQNPPPPDGSAVTPAPTPPPQSP